MSEGKASNAATAKSPKQPKSPNDQPLKKASRPDPKQQKQLVSIERKLARLENQKQEAQQRLMAATDAIEAQKLYEEVQALDAQIKPLEAQWLKLGAEELNRSQTVDLSAGCDKIWAVEQLRPTACWRCGWVKSPAFWVQKEIVMVTRFTLFTAALISCVLAGPARADEKSPADKTAAGKTDR